MSTLTPELRDRLRHELPGWLREDPDFRQWILNLARSEFADRRETENRFDRVLDELRRDREVQERKWEEQNRKWDEQNRKWDEQNRKSDEKWAEQVAENHRLHEEIMAMADKLDRKIGALGARWGLLSETAFRDGLAAILEKSFGVEVININDYDDEGLVFGRPDQVELDILIKNGLLIACEIKSSMDKAGLYIFSRKVDFYERKHQRKANRRLVITPFLDPRAAGLPEKLGIEVYADPKQATVD
ncbi:MAG TPA: DUF3782 domain-containing protein [Candidatus Competibacter sp.]|nr:DUF3782 domain-containing protein [Candidatus Competibacter sp.]